MMRTTLKAFVTLCVLVCAAQAQARKAPYGLPVGTAVVEERRLELADGKKRALVLWMHRPKNYPRDPGEESYTCPEETRGSFYRGRARVSLVDTGSGRVVNTLKVLQEYSHGEDQFDVPYRIRAGGYYHVPNVAEGREGRPEVMRLRDYNGDGRALEFALYDALACMGLQTALFGYSERQDRVIQYAFHVEEGDGVKKTRAVRLWMDYVFAREPTAPGRWKFEIDYRGRGGALDRHEIRYNPGLERFEGSVVYYVGPDN